MKPKLHHWSVIAFVHSDPVVGLCIETPVMLVDSKIREATKGAKFLLHDSATDTYTATVVSHKQVLENLDLLAEPPSVPSRLAGKRRRK